MLRPQLSGRPAHFHARNVEWSPQHDVAPTVCQGDPHENALRNGRAEMEKLEGRLDMSRETSVVDSAHRLYKLALEKNFTRGRRIAHVRPSPSPSPNPESNLNPKS